MSSEEKRKLFKGQIVTLDQIPTWNEFWKNNKSDIAKTSDEVEEVDVALADKVSLWQGDITSLEIDSIVNAANSSLLGGGGGDKFCHL